MKAAELETDKFAPTLAEMKSEYVAYLVESAFADAGPSFQPEAVLKKALFFRLSVIWMGGHGNCVFTLGKKNRSSH
jgi:hypothetical protein